VTGVMHPPLIIEAAINARWRIFASTYLLDETERVLTHKLGFSAHFGYLLSANEKFVKEFNGGIDTSRMFL
jgi:hypothetical protein